MQIIDEKHAKVHLSKPEYFEIGSNYLKSNTHTVIILAGGQGTRLNFKGPKGLFPIPKFGTLFDIHLQKIIQYEHKFQIRVQVFIMTSEFTHDEIVNFFEENYPERTFNYFKQESEICTNFEGKNLFDEYGPVRAPNGNGGVFKALKKFDLRAFETIQIISVDNVLAKVFDPVPLGILIKHDYDVVSKGIMKRRGENAGVFVDNGRIEVCEYTEMEGNGNERAVANICNHYFTRSFVESLSDVKFDFHLAKKKIPCLVDGTMVHPESPNGLKKELFIFDALKFGKSGVYLVNREREFSPLKNGVDQKSDNAVTCLADLERNVVVNDREIR